MTFLNLFTERKFINQYIFCERTKISFCICWQNTKNMFTLCLILTGFKIFTIIRLNANGGQVLNEGRLEMASHDLADVFVLLVLTSTLFSFGGSISPKFHS